MTQKETIPAEAGWFEKNIRELPGSPSERIGSGWMLITAGGADGGWNTMTASWGGLGVLWGRDVSFIFVRPSRHTYRFVNEAPVFTLSFFDESFRTALSICGSTSGRDTDKAAASGLTPINFGERIPRGAGAVGFREAREIIICRKLYAHDFDPAQFLDAPAIEANYEGRDYHRMFIGEIVSLLVKG